MATLTLKGNTIHSKGDLPAIGSMLPDFELSKSDFSKATLKDFAGSKIVMNVFISLDTSTCANSVRAFNKHASELVNTKVLCISRDLPFAQSRFCGAEGLENVITLSDFASGNFGQNYKNEMIDGPLAGLLSRIVIVADKKGKVLYTEQVQEVTEEPNYAAALEALKN